MIAHQLRALPKHLACCALIVVVLRGATAASAQEQTMPAFQPVLVGVRLVSDSVRPGGSLGVTYVFRNDGAAPDADYMVFAHFERPNRDCANIVFQQDHYPLIPTSAWESGRLVEDGPYLVPVPSDAADGAYWVHVGLWDPPSGRRLYESYYGQVTVDQSAPSPAPAPRLSAGEAARREAALDARLVSPVTIDTAHISFAVSPDTGCYRLLDKRSSVAWDSSPFAPGFGDVTVRLPSGQSKLIHLGAPDEIDRTDSELTLRYTLATQPPARFDIRVRVIPTGDGIELSWSATGAEIASVDLLSDALATTDAAGYVVVPSRLGLMLPANSGEAFLERWETFRWGGCQMEMFGVVKGGAAALVSWHDPYAVLTVKSVVRPDPPAPGGQVLASSLRVQDPAFPMRITLLGPGGYVDIAKAYREVAREKGWLVTWEEKVKRWPTLQLDRLLGAPDIKPFVLSRSVKSSRYYSGPPDAEETSHVGYTFDETAQIAEHLRNDLGVDKALFVLAGWIRRGYDNQHPDILPAAPECGGDEALVDAAARIRRLGYLFGLHDNYQDMYKDAPSWSEDAIMQRPDGSLMPGGNWAGGQAWLICAKVGLELAGRPQQNLPRVKELFDPTAYFIDTTFAAQLFDCFAPAHPMTRWDDMRYKAALSDFSTSLFGVHGSEEGMEWGVPHAAYFEGILTERKLPMYGKRIPLFELVYHDCVAMYTHQGDRAYPNTPDYIVRLIGLGRMPLYAFGPHLYWRDAVTEAVMARPTVEQLRQTAPRAFEISYRWTVEGDVAADYRAFVHFTKDNGDIVFQGDYSPEPPTTQWRAGQQVVCGPFQVEVPEGVDGTLDVRVGLFARDAGRRAMLNGADDGMQRYRIGRLRISTEQGGTVIEFEPVESPAADALCLARSDAGWARDLCLTDKLIKNTYEVMSPLNELTAKVPMSGHEFLTPDGMVQRTTFGADFEVIVNLSADNYAAKTRGGDVLLPPYGFSVWGPQFRAFHALSWNGVQYQRPALFAIRSLDGRPIEESGRVRVFHGFGDPSIKLRGAMQTVETERTISEGR
jgi:hypothetical protein